MQCALPYISRNNSMELLHNSNKRNLSYEKALRRSKLNSKELRKVIMFSKQNRKSNCIKNSLLITESNYNKEINLKLTKVGNLLNKIPRPPQKVINTNGNAYKPIIPINKPPVKLQLTRNNNSATNIKPILCLNVNNNFDNYLIHFQQQIQDILSSDSNFVLKPYQPSNGNSIHNNKKFRKLKTIYKYISDDQTAMKFHYFKEDFKDIGNSNTALINPEYKFIKIRDDSFQVLNTFKKVISCIIEHFFMAYNNDLLFKREHLISLNEYSLYLKDIYELYKTEMRDIVNNYSILTKGLINSNQIYTDYVSSLCRYSEEITKEEAIFIRSYDEMMKIDTTA